MRSRAKIAKILIWCAAFLLLCSLAQADDILYNVPETSGSGVNNAPNQTNVSYNACQFGNDLCTDLAGGDFTNNSPYTWYVNQLIVWAVDNEQVGAKTGGVTDTAPYNLTSGLALYGGNITSGYSGVVSLVSGSYSIAAAPYSGTTDGSTNYYSPIASELADSPTWDGVWQLSFNVTGLTIAPGETYVFGVGDSSSVENNSTSLIALNATTCTGASGAHPCVSDGIMIMSGGDVVGNYNYGTVGDISADVDAELLGTGVPEPATWLLLCAGAGLLGLKRRRG
jgi:hypothetical protein